MRSEVSKIRRIGSVNDGDATSAALYESIQIATDRRLDTVAIEGVERRLLQVLLMDKPLVRAKAAQSLLPVVESLKDVAYELRSDAVLAAWESDGASYAELATELGVSKSLIQIMVREARERSHEREANLC
jgi:DNA-directed RNA polymerase specialized sigma24 family protein